MFLGRGKICHFHVPYKIIFKNSVYLKCLLLLPSSRVNHIHRSPNIPIPVSMNSVGGAGPGGGGGGGGGGGVGGVGAAALPNTGSLPDLTQVQYLQPMNPPIPDTDLIVSTQPNQCYCFFFSFSSLKSVSSHWEYCTVYTQSPYVFTLKYCRFAQRMPCINTIVYTVCRMVMQQ